MLDNEVFVLYSVLTFSITLSTVYAALKYSPYCRSPYTRNNWLLKAAVIAEGLTLIFSFTFFEWAILILSSISPIFPVLYGFSIVIQIAEEMEFQGILRNDYARKRVKLARILYFGVVLSAAFILVNYIASTILISIFTLASHILALQALNVIREKAQVTYYIERIRQSVLASLILVVIAVILLLVYFANMPKNAHYEFLYGIAVIIGIPIVIILSILRIFISAFTGFRFYDSCCPSEEIRGHQWALSDLEDDTHDGENLS
jgi:hypothetical protein